MAKMNEGFLFRLALENVIGSVQLQRTVSHFEASNLRRVEMSEEGNMVRYLEVGGVDHHLVSPGLLLGLQSLLLSLR
jgi:hypothetical protein